MAENNWSITDLPLLPVAFETPAAEKTWSIVDSPLTLTQFESAPAEWSNNDWLVGLGMVQAAEVSAGLTGILAWQEQTDTCAIAGSSSSSSTISWAEASDICSISGASTLSGQIAWAESNDGCSISGAASASGSLAWTEASDTCAIDDQASSGTTGTLAWAETSDICAIVGESSAVGTISWTEAADTISATGAASSQGTLAWDEENDVAEITGFIPLVMQAPGGSYKKPRKNQRPDVEKAVAEAISKLYPAEKELITEPVEEKIVAEVRDYAGEKAVLEVVLARVKAKVRELEEAEEEDAIIALMW